MYGHKEAVSILLENEACDDMHSAAARGDVEAMEELIADGHRDVTVTNKGGETSAMPPSKAFHSVRCGPGATHS